MNRALVACPDWPSLVRHRAAADEAEPTGWPDALAHLDSCPRCRAAAVAADPTLVFRRLAAAPPLASPGSASPGSDTEEVEAMRLGVSALRAASRLAAERRPHVLHGWQRWAVAAGLGLMVLSLGSAGIPSQPTASSAGLAAAPAPFPARPTPRPNVVPVAGPSSIEGLNRPDARVYQMDGDHLSVVMIVDESLDV
ncbi:MAG TPA: hypothetical protein VGE98_07840 [Thermoanaerobaculia bacterium]